MAALKIVREAGQHDPDNALDGQGYLHMIDEVRGWMGRDKAMQAGMPTGEDLYVQHAVRREGEVAAGWGCGSTNDR